MDTDIYTLNTCIIIRTYKFKVRVRIDTTSFPRACFGFLPRSFTPTERQPNAKLTPTQAPFSLRFACFLSASVRLHFHSIVANFCVICAIAICSLQWRILSLECWNLLWFLYKKICGGKKLKWYSEFFEWLGVFLLVACTWRLASRYGGEGKQRKQRGGYGSIAEIERFESVSFLSSDLECLWRFCWNCKSY